jgi:ABC-type nitrate/sulfonate/bicarbonate transport system substrate-binding protein
LEVTSVTAQSRILCTVLLLGLASFLAAPASAQAEKATVRIDGMI